MYGIIIVDDEKYVRLWLKNCIDWSKLGFYIMGEATNGSEAMSMIAELKPRVVISDMDMPGVDGVRLIEEANRSFPEISFIILSGYKNFEYLQSAVRNNALDYLLKPVKPDDIITVFKNLIIRLTAEDERAEEEIRHEKVIKENVELRREKFFLELIDEEALTLNEVVERSKKLEIKNIGGSFCIFIVGFNEGMVKSDCDTLIDIETEKIRTINIFREQFSAINMESYYLTKKNEIIGIVNYCRQYPDAYQTIVNNLSKVILNFNSLFVFQPYIGIGSIIDDIMCLGVSYRQAKKSLELKLVFKDSRILTFLNVPTNLTSLKFSSIDENEFSNAIMTCSYERCREVVTRIFDRINGSREINVETVKTIYYRLISLILKAANEFEISPVANDDISMFRAVENFNSISQLCQAVLNYSKKVIDNISNSENIKSFAVEKAKEYILSNFKNEISLSVIAEHVHITPNYLCSLFKLETGQSIFDFIINLRIETAKSLIKDNELHLYEIGELVGYKDTKYFSKVFKKIVGVSPSSYREKLFGK